VTALVRSGAAPWRRPDGESHAPAPDASARLVAAVDTRPARGPGGVAPAAVRPGARAYGVATYLATDALRARPRDEAVELSVRHTADGGRVTVARRTAGARTVAIEAQVA
jgi:hypothetical protein